MKKVFSLFLALVLCLSLCACGKSEAVKNVEAMIDSLGEITLESIDAIRSAEDAYSALTEDEQKKVKNYETLTESRDAYYELALIGEWAELYIDMYDIEEMYNKARLLLNADGSGVDYKDGPFSWDVQDGVLNIDDYNSIYSLNIVEENGKVSLEQGDWRLLTVEDFRALLDEMFLVVDLAEVDVNDYCELYLLEHESLNEWGESNGWGATYVMVGSKAYNDGWYYFDYEDIAIEVLFPQYNVNRTFPDGSSYEYVEEATTRTMAYDKLFWYYVHPINSKSPEYTDEADVSLDQLSLGRAKGKVYFINKSYIKEIITDTGWQWTRQFVLNDGSIFDAPYDSELWCDDHPY